MTDDNGKVTFIASIANKASAFTIEGEDRAGGELRLSFSGTEIAPVLRLLTMRGQPLLVTFAPQQMDLPLGPAEPNAQVFPQAPLFQEPVTNQAVRILAADGSGVATGGNDSADLSTPTPTRRVRRGLIAHGQRKAKR